MEEANLSRVTPRERREFARSRISPLAAGLLSMVMFLTKAMLFGGTSEPCLIDRHGHGDVVGTMRISEQAVSVPEDIGTLPDGGEFQNMELVYRKK